MSMEKDEINFTAEDLAEMQRHEGFFQNMNVSTSELIAFGSNFPEIEVLQKYVTDEGIAELIEAKIAFEVFAEEKGLTRKNDGLFATFTGEKALKFADLISNLANLNSQIKNEIVPVVIHLSIKSLDIEGLDTVSENIETFLDNLEISYRDARF